MSQRSNLRASLVGISISVVVLLLLTFFFGVRLEDLAAVGLGPFAIASGLTVMRLIVQGFRFKILASDLSGVRFTFKDSVLVRLASEFVSSTAPAYVGGEAVRAYWLLKVLEDKGRAIWIAYVEIFTDIFFYTSVALLAAVYAAQQGSVFVASLIAGIAGPVLSFYIIVLIFTLKGVAGFPQLVRRLSLRFLGEAKGGRIANSFERIWLAYSQAARETFRSGSWGTGLKVILLTLLQILLGGLSLAVMVGYDIDLHDFWLLLLAVHASLALGSLPVTPGGSGISEVGLNLYLSSVLGLSSWALVVAWRVATFHVPLAISSAAAIKLLVRPPRRFQASSALDENRS